MPHTVQPAVAQSPTAACLHRACDLAAGLLTYALHCSPALQGSLHPDACLYCGGEVTPFRCGKPVLPAAAICVLFNGVQRLAVQLHHIPGYAADASEQAHEAPCTATA
jgi:hypothetical protein